MSQIGDGRKLPTNYAFALVEHRQHDKIRLRMHLTGGVKRVNTDEVEPSQRLSNMCPLVREKNRGWSIMKVLSISSLLFKIETRDAFSAYTNYSTHPTMPQK